MYKNYEIYILSTWLIFFTNDNEYIIINYLFHVSFIQALKVYMDTVSQTNLCIVYEDGLNLVIIFLLL